jgi:hypothetical protein
MIQQFVAIVPSRKGYGSFDSDCFTIGFGFVGVWSFVEESDSYFGVGGGTFLSNEIFEVSCTVSPFGTSPKTDLNSSKNCTFSASILTFFYVIFSWRKIILKNEERKIRNLVCKSKISIWKMLALKESSFIINYLSLSMSTTLYYNSASLSHITHHE